MNKALKTDAREVLKALLENGGRVKISCLSGKTCKDGNCEGLLTKDKGGPFRISSGNVDNPEITFFYLENIEKVNVEEVWIITKSSDESDNVYKQKIEAIKQLMNLMADPIGSVIFYFINSLILSSVKI